MQISIPLGFKSLTAHCKCDRDHNNHDCFTISHPTALRGFCPPCFEYRFVDPKRAELEELHKVYHAEMTRINGWRIKNERSFAKGIARHDLDPDLATEIGGRPYPNKFKNEVV